MVGQNAAPETKRDLLGERKLTVQQAAKLMGIGSTSLRRIIAEGKLPVLKILRKVLILEADVEAFLQTSRVLVRQVAPKTQDLPALPGQVATSRHLALRR